MLTMNRQSVRGCRIAYTADGDSRRFIVMRKTENFVAYDTGEPFRKKYQ